ncbi:chorismate mutase [Herpetosiphon geysericola]|uniref:chorismate mutase n=1 Tax=Herpetosiphon geysericola TaxID=70996 RepID=A0A0P6YQ71_9CHLR|nr:chorismate mutase [Herpetosiphon geysericola]KPL85177.1 chorismate mutase [Herpetosiphon geysericola]
MLVCRGVRGATVAVENTSEAVLAATSELLLAMVQANEIDLDDVACVFFTTSSNLNAQFPALAARQLGWTDLAMLCAHEMDVPGSLSMCIRVLMLWNTSRKPSEIIHCYLGDAAKLRPERAQSTALLNMPTWQPA